MAGVAGSGQKELCESIAGLIPVDKGAILHNKENIVGKSPREIANLGISLGFVPEDRLGMGLVASMGMVDNILLKTYDKNKGIFIDRKPARKMAEELVKKLEVVTPGVDTPVRLMSGGNVQKVLLGREIESNPSVLVTAYPVRGLDINSSYTIYDLLNEQKKKGVAVLRREVRDPMARLSVCVCSLFFLPLWQGDCSYSLSDIIHFPYTEPLYPVHLEVLWPFRQLLS